MNAVQLKPKNAFSSMVVQLGLPVDIGMFVAHLTISAEFENTRIIKL